MYGLLIYLQDGVHRITSNVSKQSLNKIKKFKWVDGHFYPAKVVCVHESPKFLEVISKSLRGIVPYVDLEQLTVHEENQSIEQSNSIATELHNFQIDSALLDSLNFISDEGGIVPPVDLERITVHEDDQSTEASEPTVAEFENDEIRSTLDFDSDDSIKDPTYEIDEEDNDTVPRHENSYFILDHEFTSTDRRNGFKPPNVQDQPLYLDDNVPTQKNVRGIEEHLLNLKEQDNFTLNLHAPCTSTGSSNSKCTSPCNNIIETEVDINTNIGIEENTITKTKIDITLAERVINDGPIPVENVPTATGRNTRRYFCIYCKGLFGKLPNHLESRHPNEEPIKELMKLPHGSKERRQILETIRRNGDYMHNTYKEYNSGTFLVARRPKQDRIVSAEHITSCPECKGQFVKSSLRKHAKKCIPKRKEKSNIMVLSRGIHRQIHIKACHKLKNRVFPVLRDNECVRIIRYDELVIAIGNELCKTYSDQHFDDMIRAKLRLLGRVLLKARELDDSVTDFGSLITPIRFDLVTSCINFVAGLNEEGTHFRSPSVATNLTTMFKRAANIWKVECMKKKDEEKIKDADNFLTLLTVCGSSSINRTAVENMVEHQRQKIVKLPEKRDIKKLVSFVRRIRREKYAELSKPDVNFCYETWNALSAYSLIDLLVFNRRRPGELERITLRDYNSLQGVDKTLVNSGNITEPELNATKVYKRFEIRGKLNRSVPVLVHCDIELCLNLIIKFRELAGVPADNPYVFGLPSKDSRHRYHRACEILRTISVRCGAENPELIRVTVLRKQIATECAVLDFEDNVIKDVANFMGHAENIHNKVYKLPVQTRDVVRMSRVLEIIQGSHEDSNSESDDDLYENNEEPSSKMLNVETDTNQMETDETSIGHSSNEQIKKFKSISKPKRKHITGLTRFFGPKKSWSLEEQAIVEESFSDCLLTGKLPSYERVETFKCTNSALNSRSPQSIRLWIKNQFVKRNSTTPAKSRASLKSKTQIKRPRWSKYLKKCFLSEFREHIEGSTLPSQMEIRVFMEKYPESQSKTVNSIRTAILNERKRRENG